MKRDFILVTVSMIIWGVGESAFMYFQPLYLEELGASPLMIGSILGARNIFRLAFIKNRVDICPTLYPNFSTMRNPANTTKI